MALTKSEITEVVLIIMMALLALVSGLIVQTESHDKVEQYVTCLIANGNEKYCAETNGVEDYETLRKYIKGVK